jgi:hypothetical protein
MLEKPATYFELKVLEKAVDRAELQRLTIALRGEMGDARFSKRLRRWAAP